MREDVLGGGEDVTELDHCIQQPLTAQVLYHAVGQREHVNIVFRLSAGENCEPLRLRGIGGRKICHIALRNPQLMQLLRAQCPFEGKSIHKLY